jgi:hypothetical protein
LIVADRTALSPQLLEAVSRRADEGPSTFTLLVPSRDARSMAEAAEGCISEAEERLDLAIPVISEAAGEAILGVVGSHEPLVAVQDALNLLGFDEVIISMLPVRESRWFRLDLPRKVRALGVAVTEVIATAREAEPTAA